MRIVVLGARGQLGRAMVREFDRVGYEVVPLGRRELDLTDAGSIRGIAACRPDAIINCAAYNDVDGAERETGLAMAVNVDAVAALAQVANETRATLVHFSSDFVFDGESLEPYTEVDQPNPISAYGRSKAEGEKAAAAAERHYLLRLASVFGGAAGEGAGGRTTIDRIIDASLAGHEVKAFADRTVTPSYTPDVARTTRQLLVGRAPFGLYHCGSSGWTRWADLADEVARTLNVPANVRRIAMRDVTMTARRPLQCALLNTRLAAVGIVVPHWRVALGRHIDARVPSRVVSADA